MKRQEWKKWMAGLLTAGLLLSQPAAVFADDVSADSAVSSDSVVSDSQTDPSGEKTEAEEESEEEKEKEKKEDEKDGAGDTGALESSDQKGFQEEEKADPEAEAAEETPAPENPDETAEETPTEESEEEKEEEETQSLGLLETTEEETSIDFLEDPEEEEEDEEEEEEELTEEEKKVEISTNEQLVAGQQIVHAPVIVDNFRFWTVSRKYAFAKKKGTEILEEMREDAKVVGTLPKHGLCYVLKSDAGAKETPEGEIRTHGVAALAEENGEVVQEQIETDITWMYVESGDVRGFVKDEDLYSGRRAQEILETCQETKVNPDTGELETVLSPDVKMAKAKVGPEENGAYYFLKATVEQTLIPKDYAIASEKVNIRESKDDESRIIGTVPAGGLLYIVADRGNDWVYVESADVRGFVKNELLQKDETSYEADHPDAGATSLQANILKSEAQKAASGAENSKETDQMDVEIQTDSGEVIELAGSDSNSGDVAEITVETDDGSVRTKRSDTAAAGTGSTDTDGAGSAEADDADNAGVDNAGSAGTDGAAAEDDETPASDAALGEALAADAEESEVDPLAKIDQEKYPVYYAVKEKGEANFSTAEEVIKPDENQACYYTRTSPMPGQPGGRIRDSLVSYAAEFVGNPYVWGGTSLTSGADCSGFVQSIYAQYGYSLPRTSGEQSQYGMQIPVEEAEPGDLIFYAQNGVVYHVVIYAGDGGTIEAMNESRGIAFGHVLSSDAVWATRVLEDEYEEVVDFSSDIGDQNATIEMYGEELGEFKITYYCPCELCNGSNAGQSATGAPLIQGRTIAVDPNVIPYGTQVIIGGHVFTAEDCGGAIKGNRIDIFVNEHAVCEALGTMNAHVYLAN